MNLLGAPLDAQNAEQALRERESHLRLALEAGRMGSWEWTPDNNKVAWSNSLEAIHGLEPGTFPGTFEAYQSDIHPQDRDRVVQTIIDSVQGGDEHHIEYRIIWPDGSLHWVEGRGKAFKDEQGKVVRLIGICTDITDRKRAAEILDRRAQEQTALFQLTNRLQHANSLAEVYESALDSIITALRCDRASLLLYDDRDVMRFVGWRGLSDNYRAAAEGHSPWDRSEKDPLPVVIGDVTTAEFSESLKQVVLDEGIRALGFIPLLGHGVLVGKFMVYFDQPHEFTDQDIDLAMTIGRQLASGLDRKRAEYALLANEQSLRMALEAGRMGTWEWVVGSDNVQWSPSLEAIYGFAPGTFPGNFESYQNRNHPEDRQALMDSIAKNLEFGIEHDVEHRVVWPDGSVHWVQGRGKVFRDENGTPVRMAGVTIDISARKRAEQDSRFLADASAILASEIDDNDTLQKLAQLAVPTFADWCTIDLLSPNDALTRVAVAHIDPTKVELARELQRRYPPDPNASSGVWNVIKNRRSELLAEIPDELLVDSIQDQELLTIMRDLGLRSYMSVPMTARGRVLGCITFVAAESGRNYGPGDLEIAEDLAHRAAVAIENGRLYRELRDTDRRKDTFLATLAHELRNPLAPISFALELMKMDEGSADGHLEARETISRQLGHMVRLVDDLMDVSRITQDKLKLQMSRIDLAGIVKQAVEASAPVIQANSQQLKIDLPEGPVYFMGDPTRLSQIFTNLLNNASKFTPLGGEIYLRAKRDGDSVLISVRDNGIGISPEMLPKIFDMFTQADQSLERQQSGLGIGLTLVKRLVELHNGSISAFSAGISQGSEFTVRLPEMQEPDRTLDMKNPSTHAVAGSRRILVVDDNKDAAFLFSKMLKMMGHEAQVAYEGESAIELAGEFRPELILMDIGLPLMSGYEVARRIRDHDWGTNMVLVAVTGWGQEEDRMKSREAGFDQHLVKPLGYATLCEVVSSLPSC